jgi:hypothetical protein
MDKRIYIDDFIEVLNHRSVILYIGEVDAIELRKRLDLDSVNKLYRLDYAVQTSDSSRKDFIYIENCDLQNLDWPVHTYFTEGYDVYVLYEDSAGKYYVKQKI